MQKRLLPLLAVIVVAAATLLYINRGNVETLADDTIIEGDYTIEANNKIVVSNGSTLRINGDLTVQGELSCENGPLTVIVEGDTIIEKTLSCDRGEELTKEDSTAGISLVAKGGLDIGENAEIVSNSHIQIVDAEKDLAKTTEEFEKLYEEAGEDSGDGIRVGPFITKEQSEKEVSYSPAGKSPFSKLFSIPTAYAGRTVRIRGRLVVNTPPRGVKLIVILSLPNISGINIQNFDLTGPDGNDGRDDIQKKKCRAEGEDGQNAMRFLARAPNMTINNFTLRLGSGGDGGDAETKKECDPGVAEGGAGGKSGNFKIIGSKSFNITGAFIIHPGRAGNGGSATAHGKDGKAVGEDGGKAIATGGDAEDNEKAIRARGTIAGTNLIQIGSMYGGHGGKAIALPGNGYDGKGCRSKGGDGGEAEATAGNGGNALIHLAGGGAGRTFNAEDIGGNGEDAEGRGGKGAKGGDCNPKDAGGDGGKGGDAMIIPGGGGTGGTSNGNNGNVVDETGGDGGDGGAGCPPGGGGLGGFGNPLGQPGKPGKNICPPPPAGAAPAVGVNVPAPALQPPVQPPVVIVPIVNDQPQDDGGDNGGTVPEDQGDEGEGEVEIIVEPVEDTPPPVMMLNPESWIFEHQIGGSPCPQPIGTVVINSEGTGASGWRLTSGMPMWLETTPAGSVPGEALLNFSCILEEYTTQTLNTILNFQLVNEAGELVGEPASVDVTGYISGE